MQSFYRDVIMSIWILPSILYVAFCKDTTATCILPEYLWQDGEDNSRNWISEVRHLESSSVWGSRKVMKVYKADIETKVQFPMPCADYEGDENSPCYKENVLHSRYCVQSVDVDTFKFQQGLQGEKQYICIKFVQRGPGIVQIWTSKLKNSMSADLCDQKKLIRNEWPWLAEVQEEWVPCPLVGGYDFNAYLNERKRRLCHRNWRPSRIEGECVIADGMHFLFPERGCTPFEDKSLDYAVQCWGNWTEEYYTFVVMAEVGKFPRLILRLPNDFERRRTFRAKLYLSAVCPETDRGVPPANVMHVQLELSPSESGVCYDEDREVCEEYAKDGKCKNGGLHQYGNHCKRSCGLCKLAPSTSPECHFPLQLQGEWLLFENDRREEVSIHGGQLTFSDMGSYICKTKHWEKDQYKLLSVYDNGCRPRFSCIHFIYQENGSILRFRIAKSHRVDNSFDLCKFDDDPPPVGNMFRSKDFKVLFPVSRTVLGSCGLGGLMTVDAVMAGKSCRATLSDWNPFTCKETSKMALSFRYCKNDDTVEHQEFSCEAYVDIQNMQDRYRLLITKQTTGIHDLKYSCWIIKLNQFNPKGNQPWSRAYILTRAQCGHPEDLDPIIYKPPEITFQIHNSKIERDCIIINNTPHASTTRYKVMKNTNTRNINRKPHTTPARTAAAINKTNGQVKCCFASSLQILFCLAVILNLALGQCT